MLSSTSRWEPHFSPHSVCCRLDWPGVHYVALVGLECLEAIVPQASDYQLQVCAPTPSLPILSPANAVNASPFLCFPARVASRPPPCKGFGDISFGHFVPCHFSVLLEMVRDMQGSTDAEMARDCPVSQERQRHPQKVNLKNTEAALGYPGNRGMREEPASPSCELGPQTYCFQS